MSFSQMGQKFSLIFEGNLKMGFIKILSYLYSKINSFEYSSKVKRWDLFTKPRLNKGLRAKYGLLPFLKV